MLPLYVVGVGNVLVQCNGDGNGNWGATVVLGRCKDRPVEECEPYFSDALYFHNDQRFSNLYRDLADLDYHSFCVLLLFGIGDFLCCHHSHHDFCADALPFFHTVFFRENNKIVPLNHTKRFVQFL